MAMNTPSGERERGGAGAAGGPSRTAILVAAARAFGSREPDASVRNTDVLADRLIGAEELAMLGAYPLGSINELDYGEASRLAAGARSQSRVCLDRMRWIDGRRSR
jgi:O-methyltransferase involved in polyketide biosynthesis